MQADEIIGYISLPRTTDGCVHYLRKVGTRGVQAISKVALDGLAKMTAGKVDHIRLALGSVAPVPFLCVETEGALTGRRLNQAALHEAKEKIAAEIAPIDDIRSTADYRRRVTANLFEEFLESLVQKP